jgi:hypothetical protein
MQMKGMGHIPRESPLYLEVGAVQVEGVEHVPRDTILPGSGCHAGGRGGTRPKGDPSTWIWVPCRWKEWDTSQGRPFYLEMGAMKMKGVGHVPRETLVDEKEVDNVPQIDLMKVVAPTEPSTPAQE